MCLTLGSKLLKELSMMIYCLLMIAAGQKQASPPTAIIMTVVSVVSYVTMVTFTAKVVLSRVMFI